ncbi:MAG: sulfate adenylyltransferase [Chloroflexi bacterium]|nr:MAG: sulfate adenylyltransferase [Chloroflexota bacterium]
MSVVGVRLFRVNLSHTRLDRLESVIDLISRCTSVPICIDTEGAQVRTGDLSSGSVHLVLGERLVVGGAAGRSSLALVPESAVSALEVGDLLSVDFEGVLLRIVGRDRQDLIGQVVSGGVVGSNRAVSVDRPISLPALTAKDRAALEIGKQKGIVHYALSFANDPDDIRELRSLATDQAYVISKIESRRGVANCEAIIAESDAILIDRGDLSREIPLEYIPFVQKQVIRFARAAGKPVCVATNLLESMVSKARPTRAQVSDVVNTIIDGASGLVLAAETAIGQYPIECATMIESIISDAVALRGEPDKLHNIRRDPGQLPRAHGGSLKESRTAQRLVVSDCFLLDAINLATGAYSPLEGFMDAHQVHSTLQDYRLPDGTVWPMPIVLPIPEGSAVCDGDDLALHRAGEEEPTAIVRVSTVFRLDVDRLVEFWYGTTDRSHPGVTWLLGLGTRFAAGPVVHSKRCLAELQRHVVSPLQARTIFAARGWSRVVGFHSRNVVHRAHEHIQLASLQRYHCDGVFIHPVVGPKKTGDFTGDIVMRAYAAAVEHHYPGDRVLLAGFPSYSRYAGPREAVFTALVRKNWGCSHFVVGRDHTGVGDFYAPSGAKALFDQLGDLGITPIYFSEVQYCGACNEYVDGPHADHGDLRRISGTECRRLLQQGVLPADWQMRREVSQVIVNALRAHEPVFCS